MLPAKKTIYHSEMRAACEANEHGKLYVRLVARPKKSRYPKDSATHYVKFLAWGDPEQGEYVPREFWLENAGIVAALERVAVGDWVWIQVGGGTSENASIAVWNQAGVLIASHTPTAQPAAPAAPAPAPAPVPAPPAPAPAPPPPSPAPSAPPAQPVRQEAGPGMPRNGGNGNGAARRYDRDTSLAEEMLECLRAADWIAEQYGPDALSTEDIRAIAAALFIEYQRSGRRIMPDRARQEERKLAPAAAAPAGPSGGPFVPEDDDLPF